MRLENIALKQAWQEINSELEDIHNKIKTGALSPIAYFMNKNMMDILENVIIPTYYDNQKEWLKIIENSMNDILPTFDSDRMADEYYKKMYLFGTNLQKDITDE